MISMNGFSKEFEYLNKIVEAGSFSIAAEQLYIAQPSLSQFVKRLEKNIGAEIFDRSHAPIQLTEAGKIYLEIGREIQELQHSREKQIQDLGNFIQGQVRIGSSNYRSSTLLSKVIPIVKNRYPHIHITLEEGKTKELEDFILQGKTDFSIVLHPFFNPGLQYIELFREELLLVLSSSHPLCIHKDYTLSANSKYPILNPHKLFHEPFIVMKEGQRLRSSFFEFTTENGFFPPIVLESGDMSTAQTLAAAGVGATIVPAKLAAHCTAPIPPCYFSLRNFLSDWQVVIAFKKEKYLSKAAKTVIQIIEEITKND